MRATSACANLAHRNKDVRARTYPHTVGGASPHKQPMAYIEGGGLGCKAHVRHAMISCMLGNLGRRMRNRDPRMTSKQALHLTLRAHMRRKCMEGGPGKGIGPHACPRQKSGSRRCLPNVLPASVARNLPTPFIGHFVLIDADVQYSNPAALANRTKANGAADGP